MTIFHFLAATTDTIAKFAIFLLSSVIVCTKYLSDCEVEVTNVTDRAYVITNIIP